MTQTHIPAVRSLHRGGHRQMSARVPRGTVCRLAAAVLIVGSTALVGSAGAAKAQHRDASTPGLSATTSVAQVSTTQTTRITEKKWWLQTGKLTSAQAEVSVLGPDLVTLGFGDQSPTNSEISVQVTNLSNQPLDALSTTSELVFLEPGTLNIIGYGGDDMMQRPYRDLKSRGSIALHYIPDPRDRRQVPAERLPDGRYPAYLRVFAHGAVKTFLIPVTATVRDGWSALSAPDA